VYKKETTKQEVLLGRENLSGPLNVSQNNGDRRKRFLPSSQINWLLGYKSWGWNLSLRTQRQHEEKKYKSRDEIAPPEMMLEEDGPSYHRYIGHVVNMRLTT
jgi:hypothetical protein